MNGFVRSIVVICMALVFVFLFPNEQLVLIKERMILAFAYVNTAFSVIGFEFFATKLFFFEAYIERVTKFVFAHQVIGLGEKAIDVLMIYLLVEYGVAMTLIIATPVYFLYCMSVVRSYDFFLDRGYDLLELENLKRAGQADNANKFLLWILKRRKTIFLIGSCFQLDPDGVTIMLRDERRSFWTNSLRITFPSVVISMLFWTSAWKLGVMGISFFSWLW